MMFLLAVFKAHKILSTAWMAGMALLAVAEATSNRTLIIIAILSNVTLLVVTGLNAYLGKKRGDVMAQLPGAIHKLEISLDGKLQKFVEAEKAVSHGEGVIKERDEAQARKDAVAVGISEAKKADEAAVAAAGPAPVIIEQPHDKPVPIRSQDK